MPSCARCENESVSHATVRVEYPDGVDKSALPGCPECSVFKSGRWVAKRSGRDTAGRHRPNAHDAGDGPGDPVLSPLNRSDDQDEQTNTTRN